MIKCEKCLYRKNCQFLATHKKTTVDGCTAFASESDLKAEAVKEFAERYERYLLSQLTTAPLDKKEWINFCLDELDNLKKEMAGATDG